MASFLSSRGAIRGAMGTTAQHKYPCAPGSGRGMHGKPRVLRLSPCFYWGLPLSTLNTNMAKALTKSQIAASLAETVGLTKKQAVQTLEALVALAYKNAKNSFTIPGLGKIVLVNRKARMGRNPATGETIKIAAKRVVKFRVAKAAKDAILGSK